MFQTYYDKANIQICKSGFWKTTRPYNSENNITWLNGIYQMKLLMVH